MDKYTVLEEGQLPILNYSKINKMLLNPILLPTINK